MQFSSPSATVTSLGKIQFFPGKTLHNTVGTAALLEVVKDQGDHRTHLRISVLDDAAQVIEYIADWQRESQLSFASLVEFVALQASADEVQLRLSHCPFES
ncbi:hypothetical protein Pla100_37480 [Neorhodopirellula pilleata]|uniref:Uncharacterized protein n=1 Tax=Neorhodopirellula pilleata TaxID=2714738 RepID=A0A5C6AA13_9BACT|nr:hypothetical protein Pla100_37480 [Neorhodopirellula pilleata]